MDIQFFAPANPFSTLEDEWELQNDNNSDAWQLATSLRKDGDFLRGAQHDAKRTLALSFIGKKTDGDFSLRLGNAAALAAGVVAAVGNLHCHIDGITITYSQNAQPRLDISGHAHLDGKGHGPKPSGDGGCRVYLPSPTFPALDIGCPATLGAAFTLSEECQLALRSVTYQLRVNHVDVQDRIGRHLAGDNHDGTETLSVEFTGAFGDGDFTLGAGWFRDSSATPRSNTGVNTTKLQLTHHVAHHVASATPAAGDGE